MINVLSLFDGLSGTQLALKNVGMKVNNYYASEVDKFAIKVTQANFPKTILKLTDLLILIMILLIYWSLAFLVKI
mgnify:CR=1 FL=1